MSRPIVPTRVRTVFEGRIFRVQVESLVLPGGHRLDAEIVRHPGSVVLIPRLDSGEIVLVRQYRPALGRWVWELPAGSLQRGEDPEAAARRECQEEIGLIPTSIEPLGSFFPTPGYCDEEMHFFRAGGLRAPTARDLPAHQDEDEDIESRPLGLAAIDAMIAARDVVDLKTIAGLALERLFRSREPAG